MPLLPEAGPLGSGLRVKGVMVLCFCQPPLVTPIVVKHLSLRRINLVQL